MLSVKHSREFSGTALKDCSRSTVNNLTNQRRTSSTSYEEELESIQDYNTNDVNQLNQKMDILLSSKVKSRQHIKVGLKNLLEEYNIIDLFSQSDFQDIEGVEASELEIQAEREINERIIELLSEKIVKEKENRLQTELQMNRLKTQNAKQIVVLEKMLTGMKRN